MKRNDKEAFVQETKDSLSKANAVFVSEYQGIKAGTMDTFRKSLKDRSAEIKVMRNTLACLAVKGTDVEGVTEHFKGPVAVTISYGDAAAVAKALTDFAAEQKSFVLRGGVLGAKAVTSEEVKALAELPPRDVLLAQVAGTLNNVPAGLVGVLAAIPRQLVYALKAIEEKKKAA